MPLITVTSAEITSWVGGAFWPFARVGAMFMVSPVIGGRMVPVRARLMAALAVTVVLVPMLPPGPAVDPISGEGLLITLQQLLIGLAMGFALQLVFAAMVVGGQTVAMSMGLGFASMVDPQNGVQVPVIGQYYTVVAVLLFLAMNGHLVMIEVLQTSFQDIPVAATGLTREGIWQVVQWAGNMFAGAVLIALPAVTALLMTNLAFGVITRAAPQLNIFGVGFPVTMTLGFLVLIVTLPSLQPQLEQLLSSAFGLMGQLDGGGR